MPPPPARQPSAGGQQTDLVQRPGAGRAGPPLPTAELRERGALSGGAAVAALVQGPVPRAAADAAGHTAAAAPPGHQDGGGAEGDAAAAGGSVTAGL